MLAHCRAACSLNAGPHARSMQGSMLAQCRAVRSMQGRMRAQCRVGCVLYAGPDACSMQGRMRAQCTAGCSMQGRMPPQDRQVDVRALLASISQLRLLRPVSRCQHCPLQEGFEEGDEVEGFNPATIKSSVSSGGARGNSSQGLMAAGRAHRVADRVEKENLERATLRAQTQAVVPPVSAQIISRKGFIEREKKRLAVAEEAVIAAVQNRDECLKALAQERDASKNCTCRRRALLHPYQTLRPSWVVSERKWQSSKDRRDLSRGTQKIVCPAQAMPGLIPAEL